MTKETRHSGYIRRAITTDLDKIEQWLPSDRSVPSLIENWTLTQEIFKKQGMWVWVDSGTDEPIAYFWGRLSSTSSILEVAPNRRCEGIGRKFVDFLISRQRRMVEPLLQVQCAPESSANFWRRVGFSVLMAEDERKLIARRMLNLRKRPTRIGKDVPVTVVFHSQQWPHEEMRLICAHSFTAVEKSPGYLEFPMVAACFELDDRSSLVVQVFANNIEVFMGAAKSAASLLAGVSICDNGYKLSSIKWKI